LFTYLPVKTKIILITVSVVILLYHMIFKSKSWRKGILLFTVTAVLFGINLLLLLLIESSFTQYIIYKPYISKVEIVLGILFFAEMFYLSFTAEDQEKARKARKTLYICVILSFLLILTVYILFFVLKIGG